MRIIYTTLANGIQVDIREHRRGYALTVTDVDSGQTLPSVKLFTELDVAIAYAKRCVGVTS